MRRLNLGCGDDYREGWVNIDINPDVKADIHRDLNKGLPFDDNSVDEVWCSHLLEHLDDMIFAMEEIYRVMKPNAPITIRFPYCNSPSAWNDPTHKRALNPNTFKWFEEGDYWNGKNKIRAKFKKFELFHVPSPQFEQDFHTKGLNEQQKIFYYGGVIEFILKSKAVKQ